MAYPSRGAWQFRNVTRAFYFHPTLDSISISEAQPLDLASFSGSVVDTAASITFANEDEIWVKFAGVKIFAGHIKTCTEEQVSEVGPRRYNLGAQDYTAKLDDSVIDHTADRPGEPLADRIDWILSFLNYGLTSTGVDLPGGEDCEAANFDGQTVREALGTEADEHRLSLYVDFDKDIHLFRTEVVTAPFDLDDTAPNFTSSFPYREYSLTRDSIDLATADYVQGETDSEWVIDAGLIATYGRQERAVNDSTLKTSLARQRAGARALAEQGTPTIEGHLVAHEPGLRGGMTAHIVNDLWNIDANFILTNVDISALDPHDADGTAYLRSEVTFSDRRKARGSHKDITNKLTRRRTPPSLPPETASLCNDDTILCAFTHNAQAGEFTAFAYGIASPPLIISALDHTTTSAQNGCASGLGGFGPGGKEAQAWASGGLPGTLDPNWMDVLYTFAPVAGGDIIGVADTAIVGVAWSIPTDMDGFTPVGAISLANGGSVSVPRSMLTTGMYLVLAPGWHADMNMFFCVEDLSAGTLGPAHGGEANSGQSAAPDVTAVARVFCSDGLSDWVSGDGDVDGVNATFTLISWDGVSVPQARVGALILGADDFTYDTGAGTVTLNQAPPAHADVRFRYVVAL